VKESRSIVKKARGIVIGRERVAQKRRGVVKNGGVKDWDGVVKNCLVKKINGVVENKRRGVVRNCVVVKER
jgi:hypothetical protein